MPETPLVSIIVPVYNVSEYIDRCVSSIVNQTYENIEIILVNDGSTDDSGYKCERWASKDKRIKVYNKPNGGLSSARNYGIDRMSGEYLTCVDSDDYIHKDLVKKLISYVILNEDIKLVGCSHYIESEKGMKKSEKYKKDIQLFGEREALERALYHDVVDVSAWGKLYHKDIFKEIRYPVGVLYEDVYVFAEIMSEAGCYLFINEPLYFYTKRTTSIVGSSWSHSKLDFISSVEHFCSEILKRYPDLREACMRRRVHARLSVLRYMSCCPEEDYPIRDRLIDEVLTSAWPVFINKKTPARDKVAIAALKISPKLFYILWDVYQRMSS